MEELEQNEQIARALGFTQYKYNEGSEHERLAWRYPKEYDYLRLTGGVHFEPPNFVKMLKKLREITLTIKGWEN